MWRFSIAIGLLFSAIISQAAYVEFSYVADINSGAASAPEFGEVATGSFGFDTSELPDTSQFTSFGETRNSYYNAASLSFETTGSAGVTAGASRNLNLQTSDNAQGLDYFRIYNSGAGEDTIFVSTSPILEFSGMGLLLRSTNEVTFSRDSTLGEIGESLIPLGNYDLAPRLSVSALRPDGTVASGSYYLRSLELNPVPIPAAILLLSSALAFFCRILPRIKTAQ